AGSCSGTACAGSSWACPDTIPKASLSGFDSGDAEGTGCSVVGTDDAPSARRIVSTSCSIPVHDSVGGYRSVGRNSRREGDVFPLCCSEIDWRCSRNCLSRRRDNAHLHGLRCWSVISKCRRGNAFRRCDGNGDFGGLGSGFGLRGGGLLLVINVG